MTLMLAQREKNRPSTVNQLETHFTDSGKKTFLRSTKQSSARQDSPPAHIRSGADTPYSPSAHSRQSQASVPLRVQTRSVLGLAGR